MENCGLIFCCQILLENVPFILGRGWISGFPPVSTAPMVRNTENPRFFNKDGCWRNEYSLELRLSTNFSVSNGKIGVGFSVPKCVIYSRPRVDLGVFLLLLLGGGGGGGAVVIGIIVVLETEKEREI